MKKLNKQNITLTLIFIGGLLLRLYRLGDLNLWRDEAWSANVARLSLTEIFNIASKDTQPPLHLTILNIWIKIFGSSEVSLRMVSVIFGMITVFLIYKVCKIVFTDQKYILIGTALAATSPILVTYSQEARGYALLTAITSGLIYCLLKLSDGRKYYIFFAILALLGLYTHSIFILLLIAIFTIKCGELLISNKFKIKSVVTNIGFRKLILTYLTIFVAYLPWLFIFLSQLSVLNQQGFWLKFNYTTDVLTNIVLTFSSDRFNVELAGLSRFYFFYLIITGTILLIIGMAVELRSFRKKIPVFSLMLLLSLILIYIASLKTPFFYTRYLIFLFPIIIILLVSAFQFLNKILSKTLFWLILMLFLLSSVLLFTGNISYNFNVKEDYVDAIASISFDKNTDIIVHPNGAPIHGFKYYSPIPSYIYNDIKNLNNFEGLAALKDSDYFTGDISVYKRIWLVEIDEDARVESKIENLGYYLGSSESFYGNLKVKLFIR